MSTWWFLTVLVTLSVLESISFKAMLQCPVLKSVGKGAQNQLMVLGKKMRLRFLADIISEHLPNMCILLYPENTSCDFNIFIGARLICGEVDR